MKPFRISEAARTLATPYPPSETLKKAAAGMNEQERINFIRLWVSEGIPFAFREIPMFYEIAREWLARKLEISPKEITIVGSARIGYSLRGYPEFGNPFTPSSDLDVSAITGKLFSQLCDDFIMWKEDWERGRVRPRGEREEAYWRNNSVFVPNNIEKGFVSAWLIPTRQQYITARKIGQTMFELKEKLSATPDVPRIKKASLRVYRDWSCFEKQNRVNFSLMMRSFHPTPAYPNL